MVMEHQINKIWWIEDGNPVLFKGTKHIPTFICRLTSTIFSVHLVNPEKNDIQFIVETDLEDLEPINVL